MNIFSITKTRNKLFTLKMKQGVFFFGLPGRGDKVADDCDKLRRIFSGSRAINSLFKNPDQQQRPYRFYLYTKTWYDGVTSCEGSCVYLFNEDIDLSLMADSFSMKSIKISGKSYTIYGAITHVCDDCLIPLKDRDAELDLFSSQERSPLDTMFCKCCKPDWSCTCCGGVAYKRETNDKDSKIIEEYLSRKKFLVCKDCLNDRKKQEHWRNHGNGSSVKETSFIVPEKYLCTEAIKKIQQKMGGKPPEPRENSTPFDNFDPEDIINPKSDHYWPYGMSSLEYLQHIEQIKFDNPISESFGYLGTGPEYDDDWEDIQVTDETLQEYSQKIESIHEKYPSREDYPEVISFEGEKLRLVPQVVHGFTCDNPTCQAVFQHFEYEGALQHTLSTIPMYTSRKGDLEGEIHNLSYGYERCLACIG